MPGCEITTATWICHTRINNHRWNITSGKSFSNTTSTEKVLVELHTVHQGVVKMKCRARELVWWPGIDLEIENWCKSCECNVYKAKEPKQPLKPSEWPAHTWNRLHMDFAGPIDDQMILVVVDAHTKWPEIVVMHRATSTPTIKACQLLFSRFGIPKEIVTDNSSQFVSQEFTQFFKVLGVKHTPVNNISPSIQRKSLWTKLEKIRTGHVTGVPH